MHVIKQGSEEYLKKPSGIGLGNFDGLHRGHRMLVDTLVHECQIEGIASMLYTFETHPQHILRKNLQHHRITSNDKKMEILKSCGLDAIYLARFDEAFSKMSPRDFVTQILVEGFGIRLAVVGENYRFGHKGQGDVDLLKAMGMEFGFRVRVLPLLHMYNQPVSSTVIRSNLEAGEVHQVANLLGRYFSIRGNVRTGRQMGAKLGYPTANITPDAMMSIPKLGVYATKSFYNGRYYNSITNVGRNPTFGENNPVSIETHIFHFDENLYGSDLEIFFIERIRDEKKFESVDALKTQLKQDMEYAKNFLVLYEPK